MTSVTTSAERVVEGLQGLLLQVDIAEIVVHNAHQRDAVVDLLMPRVWPARTVERLIFSRCRRMRPAGRDENVAVMEGVGQTGQAAIARSDAT
jgi:hypothetical protein